MSFTLGLKVKYFLCLLHRCTTTGVYNINYNFFKNTLTCPEFSLVFGLLDGVFRQGIWGPEFALKFYSVYYLI